MIKTKLIWPALDAVLGALPQGTSSLLDLGGMRPDYLPLAVSLFVKIRLPKRDSRAALPLTDTLKCA